MARGTSELFRGSQARLDRLRGAIRAQTLPAQRATSRRINDLRRIIPAIFPAKRWRPADGTA